MTNAKQTGRLQDLVLRCDDDSRAFRTAAAANVEHHAELLALSRRRSSFAAALSSVVRRSGGNARRVGSIAGALRRALAEVRAVLGGEHHFGDALQACHAAESRASEGYARALEIVWPPEIEDLLRAQLEEIDGARARMRVLRGAPA